MEAIFRQKMLVNTQDMSMLIKTDIKVQNGVNN